MRAYTTSSAVTVFLQGKDDQYTAVGMREEMCIPLSVFSVGDGVTDDVLKENLENPAGLLIDQARDTLDTATTSKTTNSLQKEPPPNMRARCG